VARCRVMLDTPKRLLDNSRIRQLADWTSRGVVNSRMPPAIACLVFVLLAASARPRIVQSSSWRIGELSSYRRNSNMAKTSHGENGSRPKRPLFPRNNYHKTTVSIDKITVMQHCGSQCHVDRLIIIQYFLIRLDCCNSLVVVGVFLHTAE